jgi:hypothetical protein
VLYEKEARVNRVAHWMMRLYPARWRARYGDELDALLTDTGADARVVTDLFRGGIRMQFKTWSFPKLAVALGIVGALLGAGIAFMLPKVYTSRATLEIQPARISESDIAGKPNLQLNQLIQRLTEQIMSRNSLVRIINDPRLQLYPGELRDKPLEDVVEKMKRNIWIQFVTLPGALGRRASAFDIVFSYPDRFKAQGTVFALINAFEAWNQRAAEAGLLPPNTGSIAVMDRASLPVSPLYPDRNMVMLGGFAFGVLIASVWRLVRRTGFIARRFVMVAVAFGIACLSVVIVADYLQIWPYHYRSKATLALPEGASADQIAALKTDVFSRTSLSGIVLDPRVQLYRNELKTEPLEDVIQMMKQHLTVTPFYLNNQTFFNVSFDYWDRYKAQQTVSEIVTAFIKADQRLYPSTVPPTPFPGDVMDVLDTASLPVNPTKPNWRSMVLSGGFLGFVTAAIIAMVRRRWKPEGDLSRTA